jgi:hypothetical protein
MKTVLRRSSHRSALCLLALTWQLVACAGFRQAVVDDWPDELPPAAFFVAAFETDAALQDYQALEDYLYWIEKFYEGTALYPRGWNDITADILAQSADPAYAAQLRRELRLLGRDIAAEWAKDNDVRLVDNRHLAVWGMAAERAVGEGNVDETLLLIHDDLEKLLSMELSPDAITADRYHEPDPDDFFAL